MTGPQKLWLYSLLARVALPKSSESVSQWCQAHLHFSEPGISGPFSFAAREYLRAPLDDWSDPTVTDITCVMGARTGKTRISYGGIAWTIKHEPSRFLLVKPTAKGPAGAESDARSRFLPMLRASPDMSGMIPAGSRRHDFKTAQQILGGSILDWTGSNSVGNLASNPARVVVQDETDKFNATRKRDEDGNVLEADASSLADERAKEFSNPKRFKASTPTLVHGLIWQKLLASDLRRRFTPCPHCGRHHPSSRMVILAWSKRFTLLPLTGAEAFVKWDDEARRSSGGRHASGWDLDRVERSARYECPHCGGHILDTHKSWMDRLGEWRATQPGTKGHHGYHLPSMYCSHKETNVGRMAVRFLQAKRSIEGPRNFINSDLAEAYALQGQSVKRPAGLAKQIVVTGEWLKILSVDYHQNAPYFWAVVRAWNGSDKCHGLEYRSFNQWSELDELQQKHQVIPEAVIVDVGYNQAEVLQNCANLKMASRCKLGPAVQDAKPDCIGWNPAKSFGGKRLYRDEGTGLYLPYRLKKDVDPFAGTELAHTVRVELLEFLADVFEDMLENIRSGKTGLDWTISKEVDTDEYHSHLAGKERRFEKGNPRNYKWQTVRSGYQDHLRSCELLNLVLAYRLQLISFDAIQTKGTSVPATGTAPVVPSSK